MLLLGIAGTPQWLCGKELPCRGGDVVSIPGREDPLEKEMETHSSILAWEIPWTEAPGGLQSMGSQTMGHDLATEQQQHGYPGLAIKSSLLVLNTYSG